MRAIGIRVTYLVLGAVLVLLLGALFEWRTRVEDPADAIRLLRAGRFVPLATTGSEAPTESLRPRHAPRGAVPIAILDGTIFPLEPESPVVEAGIGCFVEEAAEVTHSPGGVTANWTLRPGDLGLRDWHIELVRLGTVPGVRFDGTLTAQTPHGEVARPFTAEGVEGWVRDPERSWWAIAEGTVTSLPSAEIAATWGKRRGLGWRVAYGRKVHDGYVGAGLAIPFHRP